MTSGANPLTARATGSNLRGPAVPARQFRAFVDALERLGYDADRLLSAVAVERQTLDDPDALIPCAASGALIDHALRERPLKNLGVWLASRTPIGAHGLLDYLIMTADTVGQGLRNLAQYLRVLTGAPFLLELREQADPVLVMYHADAAAAAFGVEYSVALNVLHIREETGNRATAEYVSFAHQPEDASEIEAMLRCRVRAGASWSGIAFSRVSWAMPFPRRDSVVHRLLERHAESVQPGTTPSDNLTRDLRSAIESHFTDGKIQLSTVARDLGTSTRTLQRRLGAAGLSYQRVVDSTRRESAETLITHSSLSVGEIAYLLGYSEPAAFHRAFRRWTGTTPHLFRKRRRPVAMSLEANRSRA